MNKPEAKQIQKTAPRKSTLSGKIVSAGGTNTAIVQIQRFRRHPLYGKVVRRTRRLAVHVESVEVVVGDRVEITETRPISRTKRFIVTKKLS